MTSIKNLLLIAGIGMATTTGLISCANSTVKEEEKSPEKVAEDKNEDKFTTKASEKDAQFLVDVVGSNMAEIEMAKLAQKQSGDDAVKKVAASLEKSHQALLAELQELANKKAVSIPTDLTDDAKKDLTKMAEEKKFNNAWCKEMTYKHEKSIAKLEAQEKETTDDDIKNWIAKTLPTIRKHLDEIKTETANIK